MWANPRNALHFRAAKLIPVADATSKAAGRTPVAEQVKVGASQVVEKPVGKAGASSLL